MHPLSKNLKSVWIPSGPIIVWWTPIYYINVTGPTSARSSVVQENFKNEKLFEIQINTLFYRDNAAVEWYWIMIHKIIKGYSRINSDFCTDIDECDIGYDDCGSNSICRNDLGSYSCDCKYGFQKGRIKLISFEWKFFQSMTLVRGYIHVSSERTPAEMLIAWKNLILNGGLSWLFHIALYWLETMI